MESLPDSPKKKKITTQRANGSPESRMSDGFPFAMKGAQEYLAQYAGLTPEVVGEIARNAVAKAVEKMSATETEFFTYQGEVISQREVVDHSTQLTAAKYLIDFAKTYAGLKASTESNNKSSGPISVTVNLGGDVGEVQIVEKSGTE